MLKRQPLLAKGCAGAVFLLIIVTCLPLSLEAQVSWSQVTTTGTPPAGRQYHTAVFGNSRMIVFGGRRDDNTGTQYFNDAWVLDLTTNQWSAVAPPAEDPRPAGRWLHGAGFDPVTHKLVIFGGSNASGCLSDVWVLSNADGISPNPAWTQVTPSGTGPGGRAAFISAYDGASDRLIVAGGNNCSGWPAASAYVLNNAANGPGPAWTSLSPSGSLVPGSAGEIFGAGFYDAGSDRLAFWGYTFPLNRYMMLSNASGTAASAWNTFSGLSPAPTTAAAGATAVYNTTSNRAVFFGGLASGSKSSGLWGIGNANAVTGAPKWVSVSAGSGPSARDGHTAVYNASQDKMIVFGGAPSTGAPLNDVWTLNNATQFTWSPALPNAASIEPSTGDVGSSVTVTISGSDFDLDPGDTTILVSGSGVTVSNISVSPATTVTGPMTLTATFTIAAGAAVGNRTVTVHTGAGNDSTPLTFAAVVAGSPTLTSITPINGARGATVELTLTGTNFESGQTIVAIAGIGTAAVTVVNPTTGTATIAIPANATAGTRNVTVTTSIATSGPRPFTTIASLPTISTINPITGPASGTAIPITLTGANFVEGVNPATSQKWTTVSVSGSNVTVGPVTVTGASSISTTFTFDVNATPGPRNVTVTTPLGTTVTPRVFNLTSAAPTLTSMSRTSASPADNGVTITLRGANFIEGQTTLTFAGSGTIISGHTVTVLSSTSGTITLNLPLTTSPGTRTVTVSNGLGSSAGRTFVVNSAAPVISSMTPVSGSALKDVDLVLTGSRFRVGDTSFVFGSGSPLSIVPGTITVNAAGTRVTAKLHIDEDADVGPENIKAHTQYGDSNARIFKVTSAKPALTSISPSAANAAGPVTVSFYGSNFTNSGMSVAVTTTTGAAVSTITPGAVTYMTQNLVRAVLTIDPSAATGAYRIKLQHTSRGDTTTRVFTVTRTAGPAISGLSPSSRSMINPNFDLVIAGTNFVSDPHTIVSVEGGDGLTLGTVDVTSPTSITVPATITTPVGGTRTVKVTTPFGNATRIFTIVSALPTLDPLTVSSGSALQSPIQITLSGTNLISATTVAVDPNDVTGALAVSASTTSRTLTLTVPSNASLGSHTVTLNNGFGSAARTFTVLSPAPVLNSITPNSGSGAALIDVELNGSNFVPSMNGDNSVIQVTGITVSNVTYVNATKLTAKFNVAASSPGQYDVQITNGTFGTSGAIPFTVGGGVPTLSSIASPAYALTNTSATLVLTGVSFTSANGVTVDGSGITVSSFSVVNSTTINVGLTIGADAAGTHNVRVTSLLGTTDPKEFTIYEPPTLNTNAVSPGYGVVGNSPAVTISGTNFVNLDLSISAGSGITVTPTNVTSTSITATFAISGGAAQTTRDVVVSMLGVTLTSSAAFTVYPAPALSASNTVTPNYGAQGNTQTVTISGSNFVNAGLSISAGTGVTVTPTNVTSTSVTASFAIDSGAAQTTRDVVVNLLGVTLTSTAAFTVYPAPSLSANPVSPSYGVAGTTQTVTISGSNFANQGLSITAGAGVTVTPTNVTSTQITASFVIDSGADLTTRDVVVNMLGTTLTSTGALTLYPAPILSSLATVPSPVVAPATGTSDVSVTLTGQNFRTDFPIQINMAPGTGVTVSIALVQNSTTITATFTITNAAVGSHDVSITHLGVTTATQPFVVNAP